MTKKKVYFITVRRAGKLTEEISIDKYLTIGESPGSHISLVLPGLQEKLYRLVEKQGAQYILNIPQNVDGSITVGTNTLPIKGIIGFGFLKKRGNSYLYALPESESCTLSLGDINLTFGYKEIVIPIVVKLEPIKLDKSLKKPLVYKEDYTFLRILIISALIQFSAAGYLRTIEITKKSHIQSIESMPHRFAKLILQPPKKEIVKKTAPVPLPDEEKKKELKEEEKKDEPKKEEKPVEKKKEDIKPVEKEKEVDVASLTPPQSREAIRESVKSRGLLGVIMSKSKPLNIPDADMSKSAGQRTGGRRGSSVEDILANLDIKDTGKIGDFSSSMLSGGGEAPVQRNISDIIKEKKAVEIDESGKRDENLVFDEAARKRGEAEVYRTIQSYIGGLKYLYNNSLKNDPNLRGKVTVRIVISTEGKVEKVEMVSSTLNLPELEDAIIKRIYKWKFNVILGSEELITNYTFDFTPVG